MTRKQKTQNRNEILTWAFSFICALLVLGAALYCASIAMQVAP